MVATGRVTDEEAARLRATSDAADLAELTRAIRLRHAQNAVNAAVQAGTLTKAEAAEIRQRLALGDDPHLIPGLRRRLRRPVDPDRTG